VTPEKRLTWVEQTVIADAIAHALQAARSAPKGDFARVLVAASPTMPWTDSVWLDLAALTDDELVLLAEEPV
jgi:hypothetical protein